MSKIYLGNTQIFNSYLGNIQTITEFKSPSYAFRNDPFSASLSFATPGNLFGNFGMVYDWSDVSADIKGTGVNKSVLTADLTGSSTLNNFAADGYTKSTLRNNIGALRASDDTDMEFGSGNYTIECWFNPGADTSPNITFFYDRLGGIETSALWCRIDVADGNKLSMLTDGSGEEHNTQGSALTWTANTWYHICFQRSGNVFNTFRDGVVQGNRTLSQTLNSTSNPKYLMSRETTSTDSVYIQDYRIYKGIAKYSTAGFTPPLSMVVAI
jgi:hypothetical protein